MEALVALRELLDPGSIITPDSTTSGYENDRFHEGRAAAIVRPRTLEDVRVVVRWAYEHRIVLVAQGANSSGMGGAITDGTGMQVLLSTDRLRDRLEIDPINRTVTVSAGYERDTVDEALRPHGLTLPVDLGANPAVGGMVSTNTGGSKVLGYGDVRSMVRGLEVVLADADASVVSELPGLRKNNVGLDFKQLFIGTMGAFGIVTAATFEVPRRATEVATAWIALPDDESALDVLAALEVAAGEVLTAFEVVPASMSVMGLRHGVVPPFPAETLPPLAALVELASTGPASDPSLEQRLAAIISPLVDDGRVLDAVFGPAGKMWELRHALIRPMAREGHYVMCDVAVPRSRITELRLALDQLAEAHAPGWDAYSFGHYGDGGVHFALVWPDRHGVPVDERLADELRDRAYGLAVDMGGTFAGEHPIGTDKQALYFQYRDPRVQAISAHLKAALDPRGILGRVRLGPANGEAG